MNFPFPKAQLAASSNRIQRETTFAMRHLCWLFPELKMCEQVKQSCPCVSGCSGHCEPCGDGDDGGGCEREGCPAEHLDGGFQRLDRRGSHSVPWTIRIEGQLKITVACCSHKTEEKEQTVRKDTKIRFLKTDSYSDLLSVRPLQEDRIKNNSLSLQFEKEKSLTVHIFQFQNRPKGGLTYLKQRYAQKHAPIDSLEEVVRAIKPNAIIGNSNFS